MRVRPGDTTLIGPLSYEEWNLLRLLLARVADLTHTTAGPGSLTAINALHTKVTRARASSLCPEQQQRCLADGTPMLGNGGDVVCPACGASSGRA